MKTNSFASKYFTELMSQVRRGSSTAIQALVDTYGRYVLTTVRRHLNSKLRNQYDSADFCQAVWVSFFRLEKSCPEFKTSAHLIGYLAKIAKNKVIDECRKRLQTKGYDVTRERPYTDSGVLQDLRFRSTAPTPSAIATAKECWEKISNNLPEKVANALQMRISGMTYEEIARDTGINERHIRRVIKRIESQIDR